MTLPQPMITTTGSIDNQPQTAGQPVTAQSSSHSTTSTQVMTTSTTSMLPTAQEAVRTSSKSTNQPSKTTQLGRNTASTTIQSSRTGKKLRSVVDHF